MTRALVQMLVVGMLYLAAAPVFVVRWLIDALRGDLARTVLERGVLACPWCAEPVPLARMNTCPTCGFTSPSSLIAPCGNCGEGPFPYTACPSCGGSVKVL